MIQNILATHFRLDEHRVRVIARDVGGSFGIKVHTYADEMATVGLSILLKRPVKFVADRLESFLSDIHARDQRVLGRSPSGTTAPFSRSRSTRSAGSVPIPCIRARAPSRRTRS